MDTFKPVQESILGQSIVFLQGNAYTDNTEEWNTLYRKVAVDEQQTVPVRLVPYFAWGNRTFGDMAVWLPRKK